jgi:hypothetical protein
MAKTVRFWTTARAAVLSDPPLAADSTTTTPADKPEMMRFLVL